MPSSACKERGGVLGRPVIGGGDRGGVVKGGAAGRGGGGGEVDADRGPGGQFLWTDAAPAAAYTLSLHDALPIYRPGGPGRVGQGVGGRGPPGDPRPGVVHGHGEPD